MLKIVISLQIKFFRVNLALRSLCMSFHCLASAKRMDSAHAHTINWSFLNLKAGTEKVCFKAFTANLIFFLSKIQLAIKRPSYSQYVCHTDLECVNERSWWIHEMDEMNELNNEWMTDWNSKYKGKWSYRCEERRSLVQFYHLLDRPTEQQTDMTSCRCARTHIRNQFLKRRTLSTPE